VPITKEHLRLAIDRYENEFVDPEISGITRSFYLQVIYILILVICFALANMNPSWNSVLGTLGLGGLSLKASSKTISDAWEKFRKDRRTMMMSMTDLRVRLDLCSEDDESCLRDVESRIRQYLEEAKK